MAEGPEQSSLMSLDDSLKIMMTEQMNVQRELSSKVRDLEIKLDKHSLATIEKALKEDIKVHLDNTER